MRVLITGPALDDPGGVANYYRTVLPVLRQDPRLSVEYLPIGRGGGGPALLRFLRDQRRLKKRLADKRPELLHVNPSLNPKSFVRDGLFIRQAKRVGLPVVVFFRGWDDGFADRLEGRWLSFFQRTYGRADAFIVLASAFERRLRDWGITAPILRHTTVVDERIAADDNTGSGARARIDALPVRVLFMSRLVHAKGLLETIEAVRRLRVRGRQIALTVAGTGEALGAAQAAVAADSVLQDAVDFVGYVEGEEKRALLQRHRIFCLPTSHGEGLPNAVLEAMAAGLAVVATTAGGLADILDDKRTGRLVPPRNAEQLAESLEELVDARHQLKEIGAYNRRYARTHFLAGTVAEKLAAVYAQVLWDEDADSAALSEDAARKAI